MNVTIGGVRTVLAAVALTCSVMSLSACATTDTVAHAPVTSGATQDYSAPYEVVKAAALESVQRLNVNIQGSYETAERFQIRFSKPISGDENPCARACGRIGSLLLSADGRFVYVGDAGDVIDTRKREIVANLEALHNSRTQLEVDWVGGKAVFPGRS